MTKQNRLKILFLPAWYPSEGDLLEGVFVREHARAASRCHDVVVLYGYGDFSPSLRLWRISEAVESGIRTVRVRYGGVFSYLWRAVRRKEQREEVPRESGAKPAGSLLKALRTPKTIGADLLCYIGLFAAFRRLVRDGWRPDVIHAHVYSAAVPAVLLGRLYGVPVVVTEHTCDFSLGLLTRLELWKARFAMSRAQLILPVSDNLRRHIEAYGIKSRFVVVPNAMNTDVFRPRPSVKPEPGEDQRKRLLLVAGLSPVKGVPYLLHALSRLRETRKDFILDVVGDGPNRAEYEELSSKLGLTDAVCFHGRKAKEEVARYMQECHFYVQPSLWETFGVVYIEAMACGKPVVASDVGGVAEIVGEQRGLLVPPEDTAALAVAIEYMLDNYQNFSSEDIARYARERFSYESVAEMLDEAYRQVLDGSKRG